MLSLGQNFVLPGGMAGLLDHSDFLKKLSGSSTGVFGQAHKQSAKVAQYGLQKGPWDCSLQQLKSQQARGVCCKFCVASKSTSRWLPSQFLFYPNHPGLKATGLCEVHGIPISTSTTIHRSLCKIESAVYSMMHQTKVFLQRRFHVYFQAWTPFPSLRQWHWHGKAAAASLCHLRPPLMWVQRASYWFTGSARSWLSEIKQHIPPALYSWKFNYRNSHTCNYPIIMLECGDVVPYNQLCSSHAVSAWQKHVFWCFEFRWRLQVSYLLGETILVIIKKSILYSWVHKDCIYIQCRYICTPMINEFWVFSVSLFGPCLSRSC